MRFLSLQAKQIPEALQIKRYVTKNPPSQMVDWLYHMLFHQHNPVGVCAILTRIISGLRPIDVDRYHGDCFGLFQTLGDKSGTFHHEQVHSHA